MGRRTMCNLQKTMPLEEATLSWIRTAVILTLLLDEPFQKRLHFHSFPGPLSALEVSETRLSPANKPRNYLS